MKKNWKAIEQQWHDWMYGLTASIILILWFVLLSMLSADPTLATTGVILEVTLFSQYLSSPGRRIGLACICALLYLILLSAVYPAFMNRNKAGVFLIVAFMLMASQLTGTLRQQIEEQQRQRSHETELRLRVTELNRKLLKATGRNVIIRQLLSGIYEVCGRPSVFFHLENGKPVRVDAYPQGLIVYERENEAVLKSAEYGRTVGVGTIFCTDSVFRCYPIQSEGTTTAVAAVLMGIRGKASEQIPLIDQMVQRGADALERQRLADAQQDIITEKQIEQMRSNFLRAISHDLRSPLAAIMGACSALEQVSDTPSNSIRLISDIREESEWLTHMVENLLSVTRVGAGSPKLCFSAEAVEEIVGEAAYKCTTRFPDLNLKVEVPDELIILQMDATLITQVILNLVENAVKYGGNDVELQVVREESCARFSVRDHGAGIPPDKISGLFSGKIPEGDGVRHGLGIGLSICHTIVSAHGGQICVENCEDGGVKSSFTLPLEEI